MRVVRGTLEDAYLEAVRGMIDDLRTIGGYALREALRRKVLTVVVVLTLGFLALYWLGVREAFEEVQEFGVPDLEEETLVGATLVGLAMFVTLFLGTVLAVFLTLSAVRGDAERGLLQPLVVRPVGRTTLLLARFLAASAVCVVYVELVLRRARSSSPARPAAGGPRTRSSSGVGMRRGGRHRRGHRAARLDDPLHDGERDRRLHDLRRRPRRGAARADRRGARLRDARRHLVRSPSWALPFEALYQSALHTLTADLAGRHRASPCSSARSAARRTRARCSGRSPCVYLLVVGAIADLAFRRRDL